MQWLEKVVSVLIPFVAVVLGMVAALSVVVLWRRRSPLHRRRSPVTRDLLRPPGESLRLAIDEAHDKLHLQFTLLSIVPVVFYAAHVTESYIFCHEETATRIATSLIATTIFIALFGIQLIKALKKRDTLIRGLDGELATGQELDQLMREGCFVFHDIQTDSVGNIDHIVVSPSGVFSVETKAIGKPMEQSNSEAVVNYAEGTIRFPDRYWRIPADQLEGQKRWLSNHLSRRVGKKIEVEPMLALPGWFIKRVGRGVCIFNPRNCKKFFVQDRQILSDKEMQHVADHLEQLSRNVTPAGAKEHSFAS